MRKVINTDYYIKIYIHNHWAQVNIRTEYGESQKKKRDI